MALENNSESSNEIAQFLEKFKDTPRPQPPAEADLFAQPEPSTNVRPGPYARSFEKLEQKIHELEEKFDASTTQNHLILTELSRTREAMERQRDKDAFLEHMSRTIATLRTSVENLARTQETHSFSYREPAIQRGFDVLPEEHNPVSSYAAEAAEQEVSRLRQERDEQDRLFTSLRQKASQLKAVNSALDREIKKAQQEKLDALKKSADQAKEILSLRDQLTAAEERFQSFNFEGRIISIKREYQQKVSTLETQLKEMSDTCMRQVEEIESLKAKNTQLQAVAAEKEALQAQLAQKDQQLADLKQTITSLQNQHAADHEKQLAAHTARLRTLEEQRAQLSLALEQSQLALGTLRREKEELEKNFKELVVKINHNDAIIGQLKEKIDVLGRQNTELSQRNTALAQRNQELTQTATVLMSNNEKLSHTNQHLTRDNEALSQTNLHLAKDNKTLIAANQNLARDNEALSKTNLHLTRNNEVLAQKASAAPKPVPVPPAAPQVSPIVVTSGHNSAALLAARLVQEHAQKESTKKETQHKKPELPATPTPQTNALRQPQAPVLHSLGRTLTKVSVPEEEWEMVSAPAPKEVQTEADLPEIKVADPVPQETVLEGEDFLEKTGSFMGRMKWSIFREHR